MTAEQLTADAMRRATIEAGRDDDTCALAWSDALQEAGDEARAEFVRVQCELERLQSTYPAHCEEWHNTSESPSHWCPLCAWSGASAPLRRRHDALLLAHEHEWRKAGPCKACRGKGCLNIPDWRPPGIAYCDRCLGTGDVGGLYRAKIGKTLDWLHPVRWRRGLPDAVECTLGEVLERSRQLCVDCFATGGRVRCGQCDDGTIYGPWQATPWAKAVATHHPSVTRFVPTDREPREYTFDGVKGWLWDDGYQGIEYPADLPPPVYMALKKGVRTRWYVWYPTRDDAIDAMAVAACEVVRG